MRYLGSRALSLPWMTLFNLCRPGWRNFVALAAQQLSPLLLYLQHPNIPLGNHPFLTLGTWTSYAVDSTLGSGQGSFKDYLKDVHVIQQKANENHAQGFGSNSWPQVLLPTWGKRLRMASTYRKTAWRDAERLGPTDTVWATGPGLVGSQNIPGLSSSRLQSILFLRKQPGLGPPSLEIESGLSGTLRVEWNRHVYNVLYENRLQGWW